MAVATDTSIQRPQQPYYSPPPVPVTVYARPPPPVDRRHGDHSPAQDVPTTRQAEDARETLVSRDTADVERALGALGEVAVMGPTTSNVKTQRTLDTTERDLWTVIDQVEHLQAVTRGVTASLGGLHESPALRVAQEKVEKSCQEAETRVAQIRNLEENIAHVATQLQGHMQGVLNGYRDATSETFSRPVPGALPGGEVVADRERRLQETARTTALDVLGGPFDYDLAYEAIKDARAAKAALDEEVRREKQAQKVVGVPLAAKDHGHQSLLPPRARGRGMGRGRHTNLASGSRRTQRTTGTQVNIPGPSIKRDHTVKPTRPSTAPPRRQPRASPTRHHPPATTTTTHRPSVHPVSSQTRRVDSPFESHFWDQQPRRKDTPRIIVSPPAPREEQRTDHQQPSVVRVEPPAMERGELDESAGIVIPGAFVPFSHVADIRPLRKGEEEVMDLPITQEDESTRLPASLQGCEDVIAHTINWIGDEVFVRMATGTTPQETEETIPNTEHLVHQIAGEILRTVEDSSAAEERHRTRREMVIDALREVIATARGAEDREEEVPTRRFLEIHDVVDDVLEEEILSIPPEKDEVRLYREEMAIAEGPTEEVPKEEGPTDEEAGAKEEEEETKEEQEETKEEQEEETKEEQEETKEEQEEETKEEPPAENAEIRRRATEWLRRAVPRTPPVPRVRTPQHWSSLQPTSISSRSEGEITGESDEGRSEGEVSSTIFPDGDSNSDMDSLWMDRFPVIFAHEEESEEGEWLRPLGYKRATSSDRWKSPLARRSGTRESLSTPERGELPLPFSRTPSTTLSSFSLPSPPSTSTTIRTLSTPLSSHVHSQRDQWSPGQVFPDNITRSPTSPGELAYHGYERQSSPGEASSGEEETDVSVGEVISS